MSEPKTYTGGCHCGKVRYTVRAALDTVISCNCSMCRKKGSLLAFVPAAEFDLTSGQNDLTDYQFNKHIIRHLFCSTCGVTSFARGKGPDGTDMVALNARCLDGVEPGDLTTMAFNGRES